MLMQIKRDLNFSLRFQDMTGYDPKSCSRLCKGSHISRPMNVAGRNAYPRTFMSHPSANPRLALKLTCDYLRLEKPFKFIMPRLSFGLRPLNSTSNRAARDNAEELGRHPSALLRCCFFCRFNALPRHFLHPQFFSVSNPKP